MSSLRRSALVLGASGELGGDVARRLLGLSSTLLLHGPDRDEIKALAAELDALDEDCRVVPLAADFTSLAQARGLVDRCLQLGGVGTLVNAVDLLPPRVRTITEDGNEVTWQVNYLAPAMVALELLPLVRRHAGGRIVQVARDQHRVGTVRGNDPATGRRYHPAWAYTESKLALMMLGQTIAARLRGSDARSVAMQPAGVEAGAAQAPLSRGLMVDAVLFACTSSGVPNGAYLRGRRVHPLPRAAAGAAAQQRMWRTTCRLLGLDPRTGLSARTEPGLGDVNSG
ncbi:MAG TPA: SDR family NAD(P)-dependent oxidoreductase [Pseudonocardiaceae bacterium]|nr:SDR family NAD(P)-dependent oxidoreductase [Pseudonocardiaceae bacterium]